MDRIRPWTVNNEGKLVKHFTLRTYVSIVEGTILKVLTPINVYSIDLKDKNRARQAFLYIRDHGVDCTDKAINALLNNF